jgi:1-acyl-sn-glycerol-3-phosphate acyltransferase
MDRRRSVIARRARSVPAVIAGFVVIVATLPVTLPVGVVVDVIRRHPRLPIARLLLFGVVYLGWEVIAVATATALWVASGFGARLSGERSQRAHKTMQMRWLRSLIFNAERFLRLRIEVDGEEVLGDGPIIMLTRHASIIDTLIPGFLVDRAGMDVRYVMKRELLVDPAIDLYASRLPCYFVDRSGHDTAAELAAIEQLAREATPDDAVIIFPEGTRWTEKKRAQVQASLDERHPERAIEFKDRLDTMPPRAGGTIAVLAGLPDADVAILSYTGLEGLVGPMDAIRVIPFREPVTVSLRRLPRGTVPDDPEGQRRWLDDEWETVDLWVRTHRVT